MKFDSETNTVTLDHGERLNIGQLEGLIKLYRMGHDGIEFVVLPPVLPSVTVVAERQIASDRLRRTYTVVQLSTGEFACSCPDFQHRQVHNDGWCKHIYRAVSGFGLGNAPSLR